MAKIKSWMSKNWGYVLVGIVPFILWVINFHSQHISNKGSDWASFGGFLSGVYSPILTGGTLWVLFNQLTLQRKMNDKQVEIDKNQKDIEAFNKELNIARNSFELAVSVLDRLKVVEMNLADKFKGSCDIKSFRNDDPKTEQSVYTVSDIFSNWSDIEVVIIDFNGKDLGRGFKDAVIEGQSSVVAAFDVYFSALNELKSSDYSDIKLMYERLKALGAVLFSPEVLQAYDRDKKHFYFNE